MKKVKDFHFKQFTISQQGSSHKVGTDGVLLGAWVNIENTNSILDIGTGTGLISLMLAQRTSGKVIIDALEIQHEDAAQAKKNVEKSLWKTIINIHEVAAQNYLSGKKYDLIVSNPPYFINSWLPPDARRTMVRHTEHLSFQDLINSVIALMGPDGRFAVVLPYTEAFQFLSLANAASLFCIRQCEFKTRNHKPVERMLMEFSFKKSSCLSEAVLLYVDKDEWSEEYKNLTRDFYLKS